MEIEPMKANRNILVGLTVLGGFIGFNFARAQSTSLSLQTINTAQPAPDSIIQLTADSLGLPLIPPGALPRSGTFWLMTPGGLSAPYPFPPQGFLPTYAIAGNGEFIVDGTGGQVALSTRRNGPMAANTTVGSALEFQATSVIDLVNMVQGAQVSQMMQSMDMGVPMIGDGGSGTNDYQSTFTVPVFTTNNLWLEITRKTNTQTGLTAYLTIHKPWNDTNLFHDLYFTTNLTAPNQWGFVMRCPYTNAVVTDLTSPVGFFRLGPATNGDLTVTNDLTPLQMAQLLVPPWVTVTNVTYAGADEARGAFAGGNGCGLPIDSGVILSTGDINNAIGPNNDIGLDSLNLGQTNDADLDKLVGGGPTHDAAVLQFDIVSANTFTMQFQYVFASEEYPEWISAYNDPMAIFVSTNRVGTNWINSITNDIALVPDATNLPVSVNTINGGYFRNGSTIQAPTNAQYYVDNHDPSDSAMPPYAVAAPVFNIQYDGMTVLLTAQTNISANVAYHVKIAIADYGDQYYDSAVFIKAWSPNEYQ
jgi:hypothetical protein